MEKELLTPKQLAKVLGISAASVNYYTNLGLFSIKEKKGNSRLYDRYEIIAVFDNIKRLRKEGYSLRTIKMRLDKGYVV